MNQIALIKRAFEITRRFRVLWLFGILIALTSGSSGGNGSNFNFNSDSARPLHGDRWPDWLPMDKFQQFDPSQFDPSKYIGIILLCCCLLLLFTVALVFVNYIARASLLRSVDQIEATGAAPTWRAGLRLGRTRRTVRLFLQELIIGLGGAVAALLLLAVCASPLLLLLIEGDVTRVIGIGLTVFLELMALLFLIVVGIVLSVMGQFWARGIILGDLSIGQALAEGYAQVRSRVKDLGILWLLMVGIGIGFAIIVLPLLLLLVAVGGLLGGGLGYGVYLLTDSVPWAAVVGLPIFMVILGVPLTFVSGLYEVFKSSVWTLAYREVTLAPAVAPAALAA